MPTNIAIKAQVPGSFVRNVCDHAPIVTDLLTLCLWSAVGLLLSAVAIALGFGPELGRALAMAG